MLSALLIGLATLGQVRGQVIAPDPGPSSSATSAALAPAASLAEYDELRKAAGRDADSQVELALWCERHGLRAERDKHLSVALLTDPDHAAARGLLGYTRQADRWVRPASSPPAPADDPIRVEYRDRRSRLQDTADAHWKLALWCEQNGLADEARAHFWNVTRLEPSRDAAWKRFGYKKRDGRWLTDQQIAELKADREAQKEADAIWEPRLQDLRAALRSDDPADREQAERELASIHLPRCVPAAMKVFGTPDASDQTHLVQLLGQVDSVGASKALAWTALASDHAETRRLATETLRRRDPREFAGDLIALIGKPIKYSIQPVGGPGSPGVLRIETTGYDLSRVYSPPSTPGLLPGDRLGLDPQTGEPVAIRTSDSFVGAGWRFAGLAAFRRSDPAALDRIGDILRRQGHQELAERVVEAAAADQKNQRDLLAVVGPALDVRAARVDRIPLAEFEREAMRATMSAQAQLEADVAALEAYNRPILERNSRLFAVLGTVGGGDVPGDRESWAGWFTDLMGFRHVRNVPTRRGSVVQQAPIYFQPSPLRVDSETFEYLSIRRISCFAAGTPVWTDRGPMPIEQVEVGDLVLAQDQATGALAHRPILQRYANPPSETFVVRLGGDEITCSPFHRFWKAGAGWVMARDLKPGDPLRVVGGVKPVESITPGAVQPVFNLDVDTDASFFVGQAGALVHDNTVPGLRSQMFDSVAAEE
jgi:hypothetical protein